MKKIVNSIIYMLAKSHLGKFFYAFHVFVSEIYARYMSHAASNYYFPDANGLNMDYRVGVKYPKNIKIGANVVIGAYSQLGGMSEIILGDNVRISRGVVIETAGLDIRGVVPYKHKSKPIVIGANVWLSANCMVLGGVSVGDNSVIGAGVVLSKDVPPNTIVVGNGVRFLSK